MGRLSRDDEEVLRLEFEMKEINSQVFFFFLMLYIFVIKACGL